jgi:hypothetical protein
VYIKKKMSHSDVLGLGGKTTSKWNLKEIDNKGV